LQLRRLELEHERETRRMLIEERERERQERGQERKQQFELKKLELELSRASASPANLCAGSLPHSFCVGQAARLTLSVAHALSALGLASFR